MRGLTPIVWGMDDDAGEAPTLLEGGGMVVVAPLALLDDDADLLPLDDAALLRPLMVGFKVQVYLCASSLRFIFVILMSSSLSRFINRQA